VGGEVEAQLLREGESFAAHGACALRREGRALSRQDFAARGGEVLVRRVVADVRRVYGTALLLLLRPRGVVVRDGDRGGVRRGAGVEEVRDDARAILEHVAHAIFGEEQGAALVRETLDGDLGLARVAPPPAAIGDLARELADGRIAVAARDLREARRGGQRSARKRGGDGGDARPSRTVRAP
jgi:hypothetical protein